MIKIDEDKLIEFMELTKKVLKSHDESISSIYHKISSIYCRSSDNIDSLITKINELKRIHHIDLLITEINELKGIIKSYKASSENWKKKYNEVKKRSEYCIMDREEFECMGTEIDFNPIDNNPENEVSGIAYTPDEIKRIEQALFGK